MLLLPLQPAQGRMIKRWKQAMVRVMMKGGHWLKSLKMDPYLRPTRQGPCIERGKGPCLPVSHPQLCHCRLTVYPDRLGFPHLFPNGMDPLSSHRERSVNDGKALAHLLWFQDTAPDNRKRYRFAEEPDFIFCAVDLVRRRRSHAQYQMYASKTSDLEGLTAGDPPGLAAGPDPCAEAHEKPLSVRGQRHRKQGLVAS